MLEQLVDNDERVLWVGKPNRFLYILGNPIFYIFAIIWAGFDLFFFKIFFQGGPAAQEFRVDWSLPVPMLIFGILHLSPAIIILLAPVYRAINYHTFEYAITDKRSYLSSGIFGRDVTIVEHRFVQNLSVHVNFLEYLFKVGTVRLTPDTVARSGNDVRTVRGYRFRFIENPYGVYKMLKKLSLDVTTDQQFPNQFRPSENPGYNTSINPNNFL